MFFKKYGTKIIVSCCRARMPLEHFVLFLFFKETSSSRSQIASFGHGGREFHHRRNRNLASTFWCISYFSLSKRNVKHGCKCIGVKSRGDWHFPFCYSPTIWLSKLPTAILKCVPYLWLFSVLFVPIATLSPAKKKKKLKNNAKRRSV